MATDKKKIVRKSKRLWKKIALERANHRCEKCGSDRVNVHHIIKKSRSRLLRWDIKNAMVLCSKCHAMGRVSAHSTDYFGQEEFHKWCDKYLGEERLKYLSDREDESQSETVTFIEEELKKLENYKDDKEEHF